MTTTPSLTHQATVYYERYGLDRLMAMFRFAQVCEPHPLPLKSGKTLQMYRFALPGFNTTPAAEGYIPAPITQASTTISVTVEQYSDFMSSSALLEDTDINNTTDQMVDDLSYRASGSTDTIIRLEIDSNTAALKSTQGAFLSAQDYKAQVALLKGINVRPFSGTDFMDVHHPYVTYDVISDNTAGGFIDSLKYANGQQVLNGEIGRVGGVRLMESTNVGTSGTAPNVLYNTYIFGKGGVGICDLAGRGPDKVTDPQNQRFRTNVIKGGPSAPDPTGEIATYVSYRFVFAAKTLDTVNLRFAIVQCNASLI